MNKCWVCRLAKDTGKIGKTRGEAPAPQAQYGTIWPAIVPLCARALACTGQNRARNADNLVLTMGAEFHSNMNPSSVPMRPPWMAEDDVLSRRRPSRAFPPQGGRESFASSPE